MGSFFLHLLVGRLEVLLADAAKREAGLSAELLQMKQAHLQEVAALRGSRAELQEECDRASAGACALRGELEAVLERLADMAEGRRAVLAEADRARSEAQQDLETLRAAVKGLRGEEALREADRARLRARVGELEEVLAESRARGEALEVLG